MDSHPLQTQEADLEETTSSSFTKRQNTKKGNLDPSMWWEEVILVGPRPSSNGARMWKCRYCRKETTGGTDRVKKHLVGEGKGVRDCTAIPDIDRERLLEFSRMLNDKL